MYTCTFIDKILGPFFVCMFVCQLQQATPAIFLPPGRQPLHVAVKENHLRVASALLEAGADPNAIDYQS